jgi:hypothetical protein
MIVFTSALLGAFVASLIWAAIVFGFMTRLQRQRKELADARLVLRLYRETRTESDTQVRALLTQNERLARKLIDLAADSMPSMTAESLSSALSTTFPRRES